MTEMLMTAPPKNGWTLPEIRLKNQRREKPGWESQMADF
jgi:hypothetical protein